MAKSSFRKPAIRFDLSGFELLKDVLQELGDRHGDSVERRLARSALSAGLTKASRLIIQAAPKRTRLRKAVGKRFKKNRKTGQHEAIVGLNVGSKNGTAPHAPWYTLGTKKRVTRKGQNRGQAPAKPFVAQAFNAGRVDIETAMLRQVTKRLPIEVMKARAKFAQAASGTFEGLSNAD